MGISYIRLSSVLRMILSDTKKHEPNHVGLMFFTLLEQRSILVTNQGNIRMVIWF